MAEMTRAGVVLTLVSGVALLTVVACSGSPAAPSSAAAESASPASATAAPVTAVPTASPADVALESTPCTPTPLKFDPKSFDLTGAWAGDDGGIFYVEQTGSIVWWNELSGLAGPAERLGLGFDNVGRGVIQSDLTIKAEWAEVPRGGTFFAGPVSYKVGPDSAGDIQITKTSDPNNERDDTTWTRCQPGYPGG